MKTSTPKKETVSRKLYNAHLLRAKTSSNYFTFFRLYYKIMTRTEALFLQDLANLASAPGTITEMIHSDLYFMCTEEFLMQSDSAWTEDEQVRYLRSLRLRRFLKVKRRGDKGVRWAHLDFGKIEKALDRVLKKQSRGIPLNRIKSLLPGKPRNKKGGIPDPKKETPNGVSQKEEKNKQSSPLAKGVILAFLERNKPDVLDMSPKVHSAVDCIDIDKENGKARRNADGTASDCNKDKTPAGRVNLFGDNTEPTYWQKICGRLYEACLVKNLLSINTLPTKKHPAEQHVAKWARDAAKHEQRHPFDRADFEIEFEFQLSNLGKEWAPVTFCGDSLLKKYVDGTLKRHRQRRERNRSNGTSTNGHSTNGHTPVKVSPDAAALAKALSAQFDWGSSDDQLPAAVQRSLDDYSAYCKSLRKISRLCSDKDISGFAEYWLSLSPSPLSFVRSWFERYGARVMKWPEWSGKVQPWRLTDTIYEKEGIAAAKVYCSDGKRWGELVKEVANGR